MISIMVTEDAPKPLGISVRGLDWISAGDKVREAEKMRRDGEVENRRVIEENKLLRFLSSIPLDDWHEGGGMDGGFVTSLDVSEIPTQFSIGLHRLERGYGDPLPSIGVRAMTEEDEDELKVLDYNLTEDTPEYTRAYGLLERITSHREEKKRIADEKRRRRKEIKKTLFTEIDIFLDIQGETE